MTKGRYIYYHKRTSMALICPIASSISGFPMHVALDVRTSTTGEVMCEQLKCLDLKDRHAEFEELAHYDLMEDIIDLICSFIE